jgi:hypothetical protein
MEIAKSLCHPGFTLGNLHPDLKKSADNIYEKGIYIVAERIRTVLTIEAKAAELEAERKKYLEEHGTCAKIMGSPLHVPLMLWAGSQVGIEDPSAPCKAIFGLPVVGPADESPFFVPHVVPATMSVEELLRTAPERRKKLKASMLSRGLGENPEAARAVFEKTKEEVANKTMGPAMTEEEVTAKHGPHWNMVRRFGIEQGVNSKGERKFRGVDDHSESGNNPAAERRQKIPMAMVHHIMLMIRMVALWFPQVSWPDIKVDPLGATEDLKGAYRQIALLAAHVSLCITAVFNPESGTIDYHELYGQPFGAGHAVPNFCRVAEWACRVCRRLLHLMMEHFFDDYFLIEPEFAIASAVWSFRRVMHAFGFALETEKSQLPAKVWEALGVVFDMSAIRATNALLVRPKEARVKNFCTEVDTAVLKTKKLPPSHSSRLVGKFGFLCDTMFGRVGRAGTGALRARQYELHSDSSLTPAILAGLGWCKAAATCSPPRELRLSQDGSNPILLWTDASEEPGRKIGRHIAGAVVFSPSLPCLLYTAVVVPEEVVLKWLPKKNHIGQLEIFGGTLALDTWPDLLRDQPVIHFVDNDSATASLIKGYSPQVDSAKIVGDFWLRAARLKCFIYIDRVESKSNISDGPSRLDFTELEGLGAKWTPPNEALFSEAPPGEDPFRWFTSGSVG